MTQPLEIREREARGMLAAIVGAQSRYSAEAVTRAIIAAQDDEREQCAKIADERAQALEGIQGATAGVHVRAAEARAIAAAIRNPLSQQGETVGSVIAPTKVAADTLRRALFQHGEDQT